MHGHIRQLLVLNKGKYVFSEKAIFDTLVYLSLQNDFIPGNPQMDVVEGQV